MLEPYPNPVPVPLSKKVAVPVPQHCFWASCLRFIFMLDWREGEGTADADRGPYQRAGHAEPGGPGGGGQIMQHQKGGQ